MFETVFQDATVALRRLAGNRAVTGLLACTIAIGIAATAITLSLLDSLLLHPFPAKHPEQIVLIEGAATPPDRDRLTWWKQAESFAAMADYDSGMASIALGEETRSVPVTSISASFLDVFQIPPQYGRPFGENDETRGGGRVALLSHDLWSAAFGGDVSVLGKSITLDGTSYTVVGVMPSGFYYPGHTLIWVCRWKNGLSLDVGFNSRSRLPESLTRNVLIGRLRPGFSVSVAQVGLSTIHEQMEKEFGGRKVGFGTGPRLFLLRRVLVHNLRQALLFVFAGSLLLFLISVINCVHITLAKALARQRESAIRQALGATRCRLFLSAVIENLVVAACGGLMALLIVHWLMEVARFVLPGFSPMFNHIGLNRFVYAFTAFLSAAVALLLGATPVLYGWTSELSGFLGHGGGVSGRTGARKLRGILVITQLALALVLLISAASALRSFSRLISIAPGFDTRGTIALKLVLPRMRYKDSSQVAVFSRLLAERLEDLSGVTAVGITDSLPFSGDRGGLMCVDAAGRACPVMSQVFTIYGNYFQAMGIPILHGRSFSHKDGRPRQGIVSRALALQVWGTENPVGQTLTLEGDSGSREVVGVVGDVKFARLSESNSPQLYLPLTQGYRNFPRQELTLVIRGSPKTSALASAAKGVVVSTDKTVLTRDTWNLAALIALSTGSRRLHAFMMAVFAGLAVALAALGVYGLVARLTLARTGEVAVRMVLGADPRQIYRMILADAMRLGLAGAGLGLGISFCVTRFSWGHLFGVALPDMLTLIVAPIFMVVLVVVASLSSAKKASRMQPSQALRYE